MTAREELIQEIKQAPDVFVEELLKVLMLLKSKQAYIKTDLTEEQVDKQTVLERMGGLPQHLLHVGDLSDAIAGGRFCYLEFSSVTKKGVRSEGKMQSPSCPVNRYKALDFNCGEENRKGDRYNRSVHEP